MTDRTTLLADLVPKDRGEDAATEALAFILNKDEACLDALNKLLWDKGSDLELIKKVVTQRPEKASSRPDMTGYDRTGGKRLFVEAKFWAELGQNQASGYFDHLDEESPGVLLFIVLDSTREALWEEIKDQMVNAGKKLEHIEAFEGGWRTRIVGSDNRLMLVGWDRLLHRMAKAVPDDSSTASDIQQLRDLAQWQDHRDFQPIQMEELDTSLPRMILSINWLIYIVIYCRHEELGIATNGRRAAPQPEGYGLYFRFKGIKGKRKFFIGVNFDLWAIRKKTPLWLSIRKTVRVDVEKLQREFPQMRKDKNWYDIPIYLKTGEEHQAVLDDVVSQIGKIRDVVNPSVDPSTHSE